MFWCKLGSSNGGILKIRIFPSGRGTEPFGRSFGLPFGGVANRGSETGAGGSIEGGCWAGINKGGLAGMRGGGGNWDPLGGGGNWFTGGGRMP